MKKDRKAVKKDIKMIRKKRNAWKQDIKETEKRKDTNIKTGKTTVQTVIREREKNREKGQE